MTTQEGHKSCGQRKPRCELYPDAPVRRVYETVQFMRGKGVRRLPVVDEQGALVGIVTLDDLLALLAEELDALARLVTHEQQKEKRSRP